MLIICVSIVFYFFGDTCISEINKNWAICNYSSAPENEHMYY